MIFTCKTCNKEFAGHPSDNSKYCSKACYGDAIRNFAVHIKKRMCVKCKNEFNPNSSKQKYCNGCLTVICKTCGKEFINKDNHANKTYCSMECLSIDRSGFIPLALIGKRGTKPRTYHIKKRDKHGSAFDVEWRNKIYVRDNWTCQHCGQHGGKLQAHHIKPYKEFPDLRYELTNGITLCIKCHSKTDSYGWSKYWHGKAIAAKRIDSELDQTDIFRNQNKER